MTARPALPPFLVLAVLGGACGGLARHGLDVLYPVTAFPWSTFTINVVGSALLALLPVLAAVDRRPWLVVLLGPGFLGGFTTLSAFSEQARALVADGRTGLAAAYVASSLAAAMLAVLAVRRLSTPAERARFEAEEGEE